MGSEMCIRDRDGSCLAQDAEFEKVWDETSDVGEDDFSIAREEAGDRRKCLEFEET